MYIVSLGNFVPEYQEKRPPGEPLNDPVYVMPNGMHLPVQPAFKFIAAFGTGALFQIAGLPRFLYAPKAVLPSLPLKHRASPHAFDEYRHAEYRWRK